MLKDGLRILARNEEAEDSYRAETKGGFTGGCEFVLGAFGRGLRSRSGGWWEGCFGLWDMRETGKGVGRVGWTGKGAARTRTSLTKLPFSKLPQTSFQ